MQVDDSEQLHLVPLLVDVKVQPPKNGYDASNSIRYLPLERGASQPPAVTPPARSAAAATPVGPQPAARPGGVAPWRRANG
jgi:hypothetical protein